MIGRIMFLWWEAKVRIHTWALKGQFGKWEGGSRLEPPCNLSGASLIHIGERVQLGSHSWLNAKDDRGSGRPTLTIGGGTHVGRFVQINAWREVVIEEDVLIADRVFITDADHKFNDIKTPILNQGDHFKGKVCLKKGCWLGIGVVIMPGVTIGRNSIVSANSVVTRDVPDYTIFAGSPARMIRAIST